MRSRVDQSPDEGLQSRNGEYLPLHRGTDSKIMPYFVYKIAAVPSSAAQQPVMQETFERFKDAKKQAREIRAGLEAGSDVTVKVIFAESETEAKELLVRQKEKPILREWE